jgi:hypothetical protein
VAGVSFCHSYDELSSGFLMEIRTLEVPLRGFGAQPSHACVEFATLTLADRLKRAATIFGLGLLLALIAIPIPLVHLILVPGALLLGTALAAVRLSQRDIFQTAHGRCPFCGTDQSFSVMGRFRLPKRLYCASCQRELMLEEPTSVPPHSPT